jgi:ABC-2 type transport system permease protein
MNARGFYTLFWKELLRFYKVMLQTVIAPVITTLLYLLVFSHALGRHVVVYGQIEYTAFLIPGLVMMTIIQNAFANTSSSLIQSKVAGNIVFMLLAPLSYLELYLAFVCAAMVRGLTVGLGVYLCALPFVSLPLHSVTAVILFALVGSALLATLGMIAGIWAEKFDQLAGFQNFVVMPLIFLSGVFYSIHSLPEIWQVASRFNPFFYMIDGFRYGFFGVSDIDPRISIAAVAIFLAILIVFTVGLLRRGYRLRN